jgi:hypothetical protein
MKKYMILAKNDYNEEIFYTDIKAEAKRAFDRMMDRYLFVKAFCYNRKNELYQDITEMNEQTIYAVKTYSGAKLNQTPGGAVEELLNQEYYEFTCKEDALVYIIKSIKADRKFRLYKNGRRDYSV